MAVFEIPTGEGLARVFLDAGGGGRSWGRVAD